MHPFIRLLDKRERFVAGLMSGTSLDGVDAAIARIEGHGREARVEQVAFVSTPYPDELRDMILRNSAPETSSVLELSQLSVRLSHEYARALSEAATSAGMRLEDLDLIGSHGQTVHHVPGATDCAGIPVTSTLQIGDGSTLSALTGVTVVSDFRLADMAYGGQGAPLVPYFDHAVFSSETETRGLLNIGGISNITVLPKGAEIGSILAFDTGPGNMVIDALMRRFFDRGYDPDGRYAREGRPIDSLLADLLMDEYFLQPPPKSTGRELFGSDFLERMVAYGENLDPRATASDLVATATRLTAYAVYQAYARFVRPQHTLDGLIVSGGGAHNGYLMESLAQVFSPIPVHTSAQFGIDPDSKEALCFALLAHETVDAIPTGVPGVTGAHRPAVLGKISLPS